MINRCTRALLILALVANTTSVCVSAAFQTQVTEFTGQAVQHAIDQCATNGVRFVNVTFETRRRHWNWGNGELMKFVLKKRTPQSRLGRIQNITIDGAQGLARGTSLVSGHAERRLENINISKAQLKMPGYSETECH